MSAWAHVVGWALVHFLWQGALIALGFAAANRAARRSAPAVRYGAACVALGLMMAAPLATGAWLAGAARPQPVAALAGEGWKALPLAEGAIGAGDARIEPVGLAPARLVRRTSLAIEPLVPGLAVGWAVGVLLLSVRLLGGWLGVRRLARRDLLPVAAEWSAALARLRAQMGIRRAVGLWISPHVSGPALIGWLRPVILLPLSASSGLTPRQVELILLHELAHVRRWDYAVNLAQRLAETLLFYHPGVWWVSARIREEREHCCDDAVVERASVRDYVLALLAMEEARRPVPGLALGAGGPSLVARVRRLTSPARRADAAGRTPVAIAAAVALLALAAARPSPAPVDAPSSQPFCGADAAPAGLTLCAGLGREAAGLLRGTGHAGAVIVQDVATGAVLVSTQSAAGGDSVDVTRAALPASLWKLAIAAAWWDRGWPIEVMECPASATVAGRTITNAGRAPTLRIRVPEEMLVYSCNTAAVEMALRLSRDGGTARLAAQLGRMGFPVAGPDAPEAADPSFWASSSPGFRRAMAPLAATVHVGDLAGLALGRESARVTPLHFSRFLQAVGNGGVMRAPTIEAALAGSGGAVRVMTPATAAKLQRAMLRTVEAGTAQAAAGTQPGAWRLGGKTGTTGGRDGWFAGLVFDPAGRARYTVLTYLRHGGPGGERPTRLAAEVAKRAIGE
ncbi:MAG TPA: M56 family metallopeptidase [Longimicrobium sp.]|jgi:beta-lactamase regulating signal transducer with metallopeptidase domain